MPFDDHGVPQHSASTSLGISSVTPASAHSFSTLSCTPGPLSAGPNIALTHAGRYTASGSPTGAGRRRGRPPRGRSADHSGTVSVPATARPARLAVAGSTAGTAAAAVSAVLAALLVVPQCLAASAQPRSASRLVVLPAQPAHQIAGVDLHRAGRAAHAVDGAGLDAGVLVGLRQLVGQLVVAG